MIKNKKIKSDLFDIPYISDRMVEKFGRAGIQRVADLKGKKADKIYQQIQTATSKPTERCRCVLYVVRKAVYYAEGGRDPEKLKWNYWSDKNLRRMQEL